MLELRDISYLKNWQFQNKSIFDQEEGSWSRERRKYCLVPCTWILNFETEDFLRVAQKVEFRIILSTHEIVINKMRFD